MPLHQLVKTFTFTEDDHRHLVFSEPSQIFLDGGTNTVRLRPSDDGRYPMTADLYVISQVADPRASRRLLGFEASVRHVTRAGRQITSDGFRLHDGRSQFWWNGNAWEPNTTKWNTEFELANHVKEFSLVPAHRFGVVVQLATKDPTVTPELVAVKFLYEARLLSFLEDIVYRSLVPDMKAKLRPVAELVYRMPAAAATVDLQDVLSKVNVPFLPAGLEAAFDRTADPDLLLDILADYNPGLQLVTLTAPVPAGDIVQLAITYQPEIAVEATDPDFFEVEKVPSITLHGIEEVESSPLAQGDVVSNKSDGTAVEVPAPYRGTVRFHLTLVAPSGPDLHRMAEEVKRYAVENPILRSVALDEGYRLFLREEFQSTATPTAAGFQTSTATFELVDVLMWKKQARPTSAVRLLRGVTSRS
jgi:hypothetical protein